MTVVALVHNYQLGKATRKHQSNKTTKGAELFVISSQCCGVLLLELNHFLFPWFTHLIHCIISTWHNIARQFKYHSRNLDSRLSIRRERIQIIPLNISLSKIWKPERQNRTPVLVASEECSQPPPLSPPVVLHTDFCTYHQGDSICRVLVIWFCLFWIILIHYKRKTFLPAPFKSTRCYSWDMKSALKTRWFPRQCSEVRIWGRDWTMGAFS